MEVKIVKSKEDCGIHIDHILNDMRVEEFLQKVAETLKISIDEDTYLE